MDFRRPNSHDDIKSNRGTKSSNQEPMSTSISACKHIDREAALKPATYPTSRESQAKEGISFPVPAPASVSSEESPPKKRFFTSSNNEGIFLAVERSLRMQKEEQWKRDAENRIREMESRLVEEEQQQQEIPTLATKPAEPGKLKNNDASMSQETDYGLVEWDDEDMLQGTTTMLNKRDVLIDDMDVLLGQEDLWDDDFL
jgi:hypothetical protein